MTQQQRKNYFGDAHFLCINCPLRAVQLVKQEQKQHKQHFRARERAVNIESERLGSGGDRTESSSMLFILYLLNLKKHTKEKRDSI